MIRIVLNLLINFGSIALLTLSSLLINEQRVVFPFIWVFFNFFQWCFAVFSIQVFHLFLKFFSSVFSSSRCYCVKNCLLISFLNCSLIIHGNTSVSPYIRQICWICWFAPIVYTCLYVYRNHIICKKRSFYFFFHLYAFFYCLIFLPCSIIFNRSDKSGYPCLVLDFRETTCRLSPLF